MTPPIPDAGEDALDSAHLGPMLSTRWLGRVHEHHGCIDSTNVRALAWAEAGAPAGALVTADTQTAGRGRRGRRFASPAGAGIYASCILRFGPARPVAPLALVVGLAIAEALEGLGIPDVRLKWPNDLFVPAGKLGGVLCEAVWRQGRPTVVAGFGINVHAAPDLGRGAPYPAASLADPCGGRPPGRGRVLAAILDRLEPAAEAFEAGGFAALRPRYLARSCTVGRVVDLDDGAGGTERVRVLDVADTGELEVAAEGGGRRRRIAVGEVSLPLGGGGW